MKLEILQRNNLEEGGFSGLKEHRLVVDEKVGFSSKGAWNGLDNFVYLADARFLPNGQTRMHSHKEIDVISVMVAGNIVHEGSLSHGKNMQVGQAQVQRAGGEGFKHNEINPDNKENRMLQLWVLPDNEGEAADYKFYDLKKGQLTKIYGGNKDQDATFDSKINIEVGHFNEGQQQSKQGEFLAYMIGGSATINSTEVKDGDLVRAENLEFKAIKDAQVIIITKRSK